MARRLRLARNRWPRTWGVHIGLRFARVASESDPMPHLLSVLRPNLGKPLPYFPVAVEIAAVSLGSA